MTHGHPTQSPHQHGPHSGADPHADCGHDHRGDVHVHNHAPKDFGFAFALGTALNVGFVVLEAAAGVFANSMALLADAGHNLSDVLCLLMAWGASILVKRRPTLQYTYGFGSSTILAALANAVLLLVAAARFPGKPCSASRAPPPVAGTTMIVVAGLGILINGFTAWLFASGGERDVNIRGAYLHMAADAAISFGVVVAGFAMLMTGWNWLDPVVSLILVAAIVWATWGLLRDTTRLALHGVPAGNRSRPRAEPIGGAARRRQSSRSAYLADEHDGDGADVSPRHAGRPSRRCLYPTSDEDAERRIRDPSRDAAVRGWERYSVRARRELHDLYRGHQVAGDVDGAARDLVLFLLQGF